MWNKREEELIRPPAGTPPAATSAAMPPTAAGERREPAVIGASISIVGDVTGGEDLTILGKVEGKIDLLQHSVTVGQSGHVKADVQAKFVSVAGEVHGQPRRERADRDPEDRDHAGQPLGAPRRARGRLLLPGERRDGDAGAEGPDRPGPERACGKRGEPGGAAPKVEPAARP